jgi:hypothetical protein
MTSLFMALAKLADAFWANTHYKVHEAKIQSFNELMKLLCIAFEFTLVNYYEFNSNQVYVIDIPKHITVNNENNMGA